jgi:hypothetical protein
MSINGTQANLDADILYASGAGVKYWAFVWYGDNSVVEQSAMQTEWTYYQASPNKALINWCLCVDYGRFHQEVVEDPLTYVGYFLQATYEKVLTTRPIVYMMADDTTSTASLATDITNLRSACSGAGAGDPYFVVMDFSATAAAADRITIGADAISNYARAFSNVALSIPFSTLSTAVQSFWVSQAGTGAQVVPNVTTGWNILPIKTRGEPWYTSATTQFEMNDFVDYATPSQIASLATACKVWMAANPGSVLADTAIIYAWDEHNEGGFIRPTWTVSGPDTSVLDALEPVIS